MPEVSGCVPVFLNREVEHWDLELNPDMLIYKKKKKKRYWCRYGVDGGG